MFWVKFLIIPVVATIVLAIFLRHVLKKFDVIDSAYDEINDKRQRLRKQSMADQKELEKSEPVQEKAEGKKDK